MKFVSDGFLLKREDANQKDLYIQLINFESVVATLESEASDQLKVAESSLSYLPRQDGNIYRIVNQMEIQGYELRIPDGILYVVVH